MKSWLPKSYGELPMALSVNHFGWRETMIGLAIASLVLAALIGTFVKEPPKVETETIHHCDKSVLKRLQEILKYPQTWFLAVYALMNWAPMSLFASLWGVPYLQATYQMSNAKAASFIGLMWIGIGIGIGVGVSLPVKSKPKYRCYPK